MTCGDEAARTFKWSDLHKKIVRISVAQPNPECLEPLGVVYATDLENGKTYVLAEFKDDESTEEYLKFEKAVETAKLITDRAEALTELKAARETLGVFSAWEIRLQMSGVIFNPKIRDFEKETIIDDRHSPANVAFARIDACGLTRAPLISDGPAISVENALSELGELGKYGATEPCEGLVYRVERRGKVDFLVKYVKQEKVDGKYFPAISGKEDVWLWKA